MNKQELLALIREERARLDALVAPLDDDDLTADGVLDGLSIKDLLAHMTAWEQLCLIWVRTNHRGDGPFTEESLNALNAQMFERDRGSSLADVRQAAQRSYAEVLAMVDAQPDAALGAAPSWGQTAALWQIISSNTDEHYREHSDQIDVWLQGHA